MRHRRASKRQLSERHIPVIDRWAEHVSGLSDEELIRHTAQFRRRLVAGELVDDVLPEAFAVAGEASWRVLDHRCSADELRAGIALHGRSVVEVQDRAAAAAAVTFAVYLSALDGRGVHVMAGDGAPQTREVCRFLALTVATLAEDLDDEERHSAYAADVTIGPADQFGYDYLTDNKVPGPGERVQRDLRHAVVTEADDVLLVSVLLSLQTDGEVTSSIAMQEYLRLYPHLAGVAATIATEAELIMSGYGLTVEVMAPPERPGRRDHPDLLYSTEEFQLQALVEAAAGYHAAGRPVLIRADTPGTVERLGELLAAQGLTASAPHPRRPLAHAGTPGAVTLLSEHVQDREVVPGGDLDWLAEEEVLASGLDPVITSAATWEEAVAGARRRLLPSWAAARQRVIEAGGLAVLGAERLESAWLEARTRELAGPRGDTRFILSLEEILSTPSLSRLKGLAGTNPEPLTGWLITKPVDRIRRQFHRNVVGLRRRAFDYAAIGSALRERFYAERRRLVEGRDPLAEMIAMIGPSRIEDLEARAAELAGSATADQVRSGARAILDEEWAWCLRDLRSSYDGYWEEGLPEDSLAACRRQAEERFKAMRRDVRERLVDHLLDLEKEHRNRETVRRGWYYTREVGFRTWPASGERRST